MLTLSQQSVIHLCRFMGIDTQLHVKSRNQDAKRVAMLERKLTMIEHSGTSS